MLTSKRAWCVRGGGGACEWRVLCDNVAVNLHTGELSPPCSMQAHSPSTTACACICASHTCSGASNTHGPAPPSSPLPPLNTQALQPVHTCFPAHTLSPAHRTPAFDMWGVCVRAQVPDHDVIVTNPPYSGEHKARLFSWLLDQQRESHTNPSRRSRPFMLLLPAHTAKWTPWRTFLWALSRLRKGKTGVTLTEARERTKKLANLGDELETKAGVFYFAPADKYEFAAAVASRDEAPFFGVCARVSARRACVRALTRVFVHMCVCGILAHDCRRAHWQTSYGLASHLCPPPPSP